MTETRKQIIELIEPYMDKTLSFWCLVFRRQSEDIHIVSNVSDCKRWISCPIDWWGSIILNTGEDYYEIGHYDITAVLKYIENNEDFYTDFDWPANRVENFKFIITDVQDNIIWTFPSKPLNLYTEREQKDLLELLEKLQWQK